MGDDILRGGDGVDQFDGGSGHDVIADRADGESTNGALITVDTRVVITPTATDTDGHVAVLPSNVTYLDEWNDFVVEVWGSTPDDDLTSIRSFSINVPFDGDVYEATLVEYGPAFTDNPLHDIDNLTGIVNGISATTPEEEIGREQFVLLVRVTFQIKAGVDLSNSASGRYILPIVDDRLTANGVMLDTAGGEEADSNEPAQPMARIWPVMYDLDDSGGISFGDLSLFADLFGQSVTSNDMAYRADFDRDGGISFGDLSFFADNFNRTRE
jgi:hypothetical protein